MAAPLPANVTAAQMQVILDDLKAYGQTLNVGPDTVLRFVEEELLNVARGGQQPDWVFVRQQIKRRADSAADTPPPAGFTWERQTLLDQGVVRERRRLVGAWETVTERPA